MNRSDQSAMSEGSPTPWFTFFDGSSSSLVGGKYAKWLMLFSLFVVPVFVVLVAYPESLTSALSATSSSTNTPKGASTGKFDVRRANEGWDFVGRFSGVETFVKRTDSSSPVLSFRGVAVLDVHISDCLGPFVNVTHSLEWISMLRSIEQLPHHTSEDPNFDIIYQV